MQTCVLIPPELSLVLSPSGGMEIGVSVWTTCSLTPGTVFHADDGQMRLDLLEVFRLIDPDDIRRRYGAEDEVIQVEGHVVRHCNWVRFLGKASSPSEANLLAQHSRDHAPGFVVIRKVAPNEELRAFFHDDHQLTSRGHLKVRGQGHRLGMREGPAGALIHAIDKGELDMESGKNGEVEEKVIKVSTTCGTFQNLGEQCETPKTRWDFVVSSISGSGSSGFSSSNWSGLEKTKKNNQRIKNRSRIQSIRRNHDVSIDSAVQSDDSDDDHVTYNVVMASQSGHMRDDVIHAPNYVRNSMTQSDYGDVTRDNEIQHRKHVDDKEWDAEKKREQEAEGDMVRVTTHVAPTTRRKGQKKLLPCCHCGKEFDRPSLLTRHIRTHTGERPFPCAYCSSSFSTSSGRNTHQLIHTGEKPHKCSECSESFTASSNLYYHYMTHKGEKPHKCSLCEKSFPTPGDLKNHTYAHTGEYPYNCNVCGKGFGKQASLRSHAMKHTGEKPFRCVHCDKRFASQSNLKAHLKTHPGLNRICRQCSRHYLLNDSPASELCPKCLFGSLGAPRKTPNNNPTVKQEDQPTKKYNSKLFTIESLVATPKSKAVTSDVIGESVAPIR